MEIPSSVNEAEKAISVIACAKWAVEIISFLKFI
jgi:hypothetical protein